MANKKRSGDDETSATKRSRVSEATAASDRPRRATRSQVTSETIAPAPEAKEKKPNKPVQSKSRGNTKAADGATSEAAAAASDERPAGQRNYWLMKAEPESRLEKGVDVKFSIDDLAAKEEPEPWDGVRNPVAQKNMRSMQQGDLAFFYHSNCKVPGIAGVMKIVREHSVDESAFDSKHPYYDPKSSRDKPRWCVVHVKHVTTFKDFIPLKVLQSHRGPGQPLADMQVLKMSRLSVSKVSEAEWAFILKDLAMVNRQELEKSAA